jgi:signal transduction histidine kinase
MAADRAQGRTDFLSALAHELRTPLNGMIGFSDLLHRGDVGPLSPDQKEVVTDVLTSARHLLEIVDGALDLARLDQGRLELRPEPVDLATRLPAFCEDARGLAGQKSVELSVEVEPGLDPVILDPEKLQRVVYHAVADAVRRTREGGRLVLRARASGPASFRLELAPHGDPLPRDAFGPLGLGASLAARLVEVQGGEAGFGGEAGLFFAVLPRMPVVGRQAT